MARLIVFSLFVCVCRGKHFPASFRGINTASDAKGISIERVMPVVIVRDPYTWMQVRNSYQLLFIFFSCFRS